MRSSPACSRKKKKEEEEKGRNPELHTPKPTPLVLDLTSQYNILVKNTCIYFVNSPFVFNINVKLVYNS